MARGNETDWTRDLFIETYRKRADPVTAGRIIEVLERADHLGRLILEKTVNPAFGIASDEGKRLFSIREHNANGISGRISLFPKLTRRALPGQYEALRESLAPITTRDAEESHGSWDVASIADLSENGYHHLLEVLDGLGPMSVSEAIEA